MRVGFDTPEMAELADFIHSFCEELPVCAGCTFPEVSRQDTRCPDCDLPIAWVEVVPSSRALPPQCIGCGKFLRRSAAWNQCGDCDTREPGET